MIYIVSLFKEVAPPGGKSSATDKSVVNSDIQWVAKFKGNGSRVQRKKEQDSRKKMSESIEAKLYKKIA